MGGIRTRVRYRDCLYYGTFLRDTLTGVVSSAVGVPAGATGCVACNDTLILPEDLNVPLLQAAVGNMFEFMHCDPIVLRDLELDGNIDAAILGGRAHEADGMQTPYDGIVLDGSSRCSIENVHAHHFGRDGLTILSSYDDPIPFTERYPALVVQLDTTDQSGTIIFNNTIENSSFNWNTRQGISWTACAGLQVSDTDLNYNGAGRINRSKPGSGLDIESTGGPLRVRYGVFDHCNFLHNRQAGVVSDNYRCHGQKDFRFNDCTFKAGAGEIALWPETKGMKFYNCKVYGKVHQMFERAENRPHDPDDDLVFRRTEFHEDDGVWNYIGDYSDPAVWALECNSFASHKLDILNGPISGRKANITYDSCGFYTNCYANLRFLGRPLEDQHFPYCEDCDSCNVQGNNCPPGSCLLHGPFPGPPDAPTDARYVKLLISRIINTGRLRCNNTTVIFSVELTTSTNLQVNIPTEVRGAINATDINHNPVGTSYNWFPSCHPDYCPTPSISYTDYGDSFPPCKPFFGLSDTVTHWAFCQPAAGNIPTTPCGSYTLTKTASPTATQPDSTVTFTIAVCNNTFLAGPVLLSDPLPPAFTATGATAGWDTLRG